MLRDRLKEKDESLEKKSRQLSSLVSDKKKLEEELNDVKDQLEGKNRKLNSLQRKVGLQLFSLDYPNYCL